MQPHLHLPRDARSLNLIVSAGGGEGSTALILALREAEIPARYAFADTGWESPRTYDRIDALENLLCIRIDRVGDADGEKRVRARERAGLPEWPRPRCTWYLKQGPLREYHDRVARETGCETVNALAVRAGELGRFDRAVVFELDPEWRGYVWRPLLTWTWAEVRAVHQRHGLQFERSGRVVVAPVRSDLAVFS